MNGITAVFRLAGLVFLVTAILKLLSVVMGDNPALSSPDPILFISTKYLIVLTAGIEFVVTYFLLLRTQAVGTAVITFAFTSLLLVYRLLLPTQSATCPCLGGALKASSPIVAAFNAAAVPFLLILLVAAIAGCFIRRGQKI
jgi:hypothetical protein